MRKHYLAFFLDLFIVFSSFLVCIWIKPGNNNYVKDYFEQFLVFLLIWGICSIIFKKYSSLLTFFDNVFNNIIISNIFTFAVVTSIMYVLRIDYFSRVIVVGTITIASIIEILFSAVYISIIKATDTYDDIESSIKKTDHKMIDTLATIVKVNRKRPDPSLQDRERALLVEIDKDAFEFIFSYARIDTPNTLIISTTSRFNIDMQLAPQFDSIVNLERINDVRYINKFFESANFKLVNKGLFISYVETKDLRKKRILKKYPPVINFFVYSFDFVIKRLFPKFLITKKIYFFLTRGQNRVLTKAEIFGRLYSCGFEIIAEKQIKNNLYFVSRKIKNPLFPTRPTYGPLIKLERIGKDGKIISVYKMRTMHPFAEYLQEYIYEKVGLDNGGKFKNDFRVSNIGKLMRTFWIDEFPMLINVLKGDLKIVGVRPLSKQYFNLYTKELREKRIKTKPGLIPPFYVDFPDTLEEIMASELKYIEAYEKNPFITDIKYFFKAIYNIIFKRYRSK